MKGQLECPLGLMDILEDVRMRFWQGKDMGAIRFNPGAERLLVLGTVELLLSHF